MTILKRIDPARESAPAHALLSADERGQHRWWRVLAVMAAAIIPAVFIGSVVQFGVVQPLFHALGDEADVAKIGVVAIYMAALFGVALLSLGWATRRLHGRPAMSLVESSTHRFTLRGVAFGFLAYGVLMLALAVIREPSAVASSFEDKGAAQLALTGLPLLAAFLIQGSAEEVLLRGYMPQVLMRWVRKPWVALLIPTVVFALLHLGYGTGHFVSSALFAMFAVTVVLMRGQLSEVCGAHAANNFVIAWLLSDIDDATAGVVEGIVVGDIIADLALYIGFVALLVWRTHRLKSNPEPLLHTAEA